MTAVVTAVTAGGTGTAKTTALLTGLTDALIAEITRTYPVAPNQTSKIAEVRAELVTNVADFVTALGL